jgi:hypothetical protein
MSYLPNAYLLLKSSLEELGVMIHACNPSTWEAETGRLVYIVTACLKTTTTKKSSLDEYRWLTVSTLQSLESIQNAC